MVGNTNSEIWKPIKGYENYSVSSLGNFKNSDGRLLKKNLTQKGYYHITLCKNRIPKTFKAHRLVAASFLDNPLNKETVNHKNGIKTDNNISNLEWNTHTENVRHAVKTGLLKSQKGSNNYWFGKFRGDSSRAKIVLDLQTGIFYDCAKDAADAKCLSYNQLKNRLRGVTFNNTSLIYA